MNDLRHSHPARSGDPTFKRAAPGADVLAMDTTSDSSTRTASEADSGSTFVEILISIVLLGFAVLAVIGGIHVVIVSSSSSNEQAKVEAILTSAADRLAATDYIPCPSFENGDYANLIDAAVQTVDDPNWDQPDTIKIDDISFWDASAGSARNAAGDPIEADGDWGPTNGLTCNSDINLTTSRTLQRVKIRVTAPNGGISRTIEVVKSPIVADPPDPTTSTTTPNTTP